MALCGDTTNSSKETYHDSFLQGNTEKQSLPFWIICQHMVILIGKHRESDENSLYNKHTVGESGQWTGKGLQMYEFPWVWVKIRYPNNGMVNTKLD